MQVKTVLFDLGGTLVKLVESPKICNTILKSFGVKVSVDEVLKAHRANEKEFDVLEGMMKLGGDFWIKWNMKLLKRLGIQENREFLAKKIFELWWDYAHLEVYPDVIETLAQLKTKGVKVGVVTNGSENDFQQILGKVGLLDYFEVVVGIDTCNRAKPDKEIFLYAVNKLQILPEETIFVGDSIKYDYEGAKKAGLRPLLIDREGKTPKGVDIIRNLTEVLLHI